MKVLNVHVNLNIKLVVLQKSQTDVRHVLENLRQPTDQLCLENFLKACDFKFFKMRPDVFNSRALAL